MSAVEEIIDVEAIRFPAVTIEHGEPYKDGEYGETWQFPVRICGEKAGYLLRYTKGYSSPWHAALYFGDPLTAMISHGFGNTAKEAVTDSLTRFVTQAQQELDHIKMMAMLYGDQIALAASHLDSDSHAQL